MKNILIFFDGTRNTIKDYYGKGSSTVIRKGFNIIAKHPSASLIESVKKKGNIEIHRCRVSAKNELPCLAIYIEGINNILDALTGRGMLERVSLAYSEVVNTYEHGDKIHIYGFSRGAASALCFAHYVNDFGILAPTELINRMSTRTWIENRAHINDKSYSWKQAVVENCIEKGHQKRKGPIENITLIDTVFSTKECPVEKNIWLSDVTGIARSVTHFVAKHEDRGPFYPLRLDQLEYILQSEIEPSEEKLGFFRPINGGMYVLTPEKFKCLSTISVDGSHSDAGGFYDTSALGLPVFDHIRTQFIAADIPFDEKAYNDIKSKMTDLEIRLEKWWDALSFIAKVALLFNTRSPLRRLNKRARTTDYDTNYTSALRSCDPQTGNIDTDVNIFFYMPYDIVRRAILAKISEIPIPQNWDDYMSSSFSITEFDFTTCESSVIFKKNTTAPPLNGCLFSYRDVASEMKSMLSGTSRMIPIAKNELQLARNNKTIAWLKEMRISYEKESIQNQGLELSRARLYLGARQENVKNNKMASENIKVLKKITTDILREEPQKGKQLEEYLCLTLSLTQDDVQA